MTKALYVALDFFHGDAYHGSAGAGAHHFVVLQPFLVEGDGFTSPSLPEYLEDWTPAKLAEPGGLVLIRKTEKDDMPARIQAGVQAEKVTVTPVPFPPGTGMKLRLSWDGGSAVVERTGAPTGPLALYDDAAGAAAAWAEFAAKNYFSAEIRRAAHLTEAQRRVMADWVYGLNALLTGPDAVTVNGDSQDAKKRVLDTLTAVQAHVDPKEKSAEAWVAALTGDLRARMVALLDFLWAQPAGLDEALHPPILRYSADQLKAHAADLFQGDNAPPTYQQWLWNGLGQHLKRGRDIGELGRALTRLYGFGERLRWPSARIGAAADHAHFMELPPVSADDPGAGWFLTNAHSLAGQVFRMGPVPFEPLPAKFEFDELSVQGRGVWEKEADEDPFEAELLALHRSAKEARDRGLRFRASLRPGDDGARKGRVWFLPRNARPAALGLTRPDGDARARLLGVPGTLLDALEPAPRVDMPVGGALIRTNRQPALLRPANLRNDLAKEPAWDPKDTQLLLQVRVQLRQLSLAGSDGGAQLFEAVLAGEYLDRDREVIRRAFAAATAREPSAALWISRGGEAAGTLEHYPLAGAARPRTDAADGFLVVAKPAKELLDKLPPASDAAGGGVFVDFVIDARGEWTKPRPGRAATEVAFNLIATRLDPLPPLVLAEHFEHRVSRSTERLMERRGLWLEGVRADGTVERWSETNPDPLWEHFGNFNKLRVSLAGGGGGIPLSHPDALVPLPPGPLATDRPDEQGLPAGAGNPPFSYWLVHQFSEDVRGDGDAVSEAGHYRGVYTAGTPYRLQGDVEHQYGYRVPVGTEDDRMLSLELSTPVRHLAAVSFQVPAAAGGEAPPAVPAVVYGHQPGTPERITLRLNPEVFRIALKAYRDPSAPSSAKLRELYEALAEVEFDTRTLRLELWNFDNAQAPPAPSTVADPDGAQEFPSIVRHTRFEGFGERSLPEARAWTALLAPTFADFVTRVTAAAADAAHPAWREVVLPLDAAWRWRFEAHDAELGPAPEPASLSQGVTLIRLGLALARPEERVIDATYGEAEYLPLDPGNEVRAETAAFPVASTAGLEPAAAAAAVRDARDAGDAARREFRKILAADPPSPLRAAFAWVLADPDAAPRERAAGKDPARHARLFGDLHRYLVVPRGAARGVDRVVDLHYVGHAFRPLTVHPDLRDGWTTQEFAGYLLAVLGALASGRPATLNALLGTVPADAEMAWAQRQAALRLLRTVGGRAGVAERLYGLVARVENDLSALTGASPEAQALFKHVVKLAQGLEPELRSVLVELFAADPSVFTTGKAVGVGVFDPRTFSRDLHSVQLTKRIRDTDAGVGFPAQDVDRFPFTRFFGTKSNRFLVDVLDDQSYDNEFDIRDNRYRLKSGKERVPGEPVERGQVAALDRGDTLGRTGEDVVEQENTFEQLAPAFRAVEADVVHYNPEWRESPKDPPRYQLPSRRYPRTPKPLVTANETDRVSPLFADPDGGPLDAQFGPRMTSVLDRKKEVVLDAGVQGAPSLVIRRAHAPAVEPLHRTGWHRLDSYVSHYYFLVEPDEEGGFNRDAFIVEVERAQALPEPAPPPVPESGLPPLRQWFTYQRTREEARQAGTQDKEIPPPAPVPLPALVSELEKWLAPSDGTPGLLHPLDEADPAVKGVASVLRHTDAGWRLTRRKDTGEATEDLAGVLAAEVMELYRGKTAAEPEKPTGRRVLHVTVLEDVWRPTRVRVRIARNDTDPNDNQEPDISRAFVMHSPASEWAANGPSVQRVADQHLVLGRDKLALWAQPVTADPHLFKGVIDRHVTETLIGGQPFWNLREMRSGAVTVTGAVLQPIVDRAPQKAPGDARDATVVREHTNARQILPERPGSELAALTDRISKEQVRTVTPAFRTVWRRDGVAVLEVVWKVTWRRSS